MKWYEGGIAEAINVSKAKGAIFVVYIEGKDEKSQHITSLVETEEVGSKLGGQNFVAIKLEADSLPHKQFSEIYKETPVPSLYFIGKNGLPIKIIKEATDASTLAKDLDDVLASAGISATQSSTQNAASASQSFISSEQKQVAQKPANVVCENGVCTIKRDPDPSEVSPGGSEGDQSSSAEEKLERAKKLLEAKRLEKEREEKELERQREIERRKTGQEVQKMKKWQEDQELKQLKEEREREKRQEKEARERVLAQIAQDKADRASRFQPAASSTPTNKDTPQPTAGPSSKPDTNTARLQFKMPDGTSKTQEFPSTDKLSSVINYIKANLNLSSTKFTISTTFPRRQFTETDHSQTLADLELTPNAVILVLPLNHGTVSTNQGPGGLQGFIWTLLAPLLGLLNIIKAFFGFTDQGHVSGDHPSTSRGYTGGNRSNSVVHVSSKYDLENRLKAAGSRLVVIDFFATWCGPCRMIAPELDRMASEFSNVVFLKIDVDQNGDISRDYGVSAMPTFVFLKNRREVSRVQGADSYSLRSTIQRYK